MRDVVGIRRAILRDGFVDDEDDVAAAAISKTQ